MISFIIIGRNEGWKLTICFQSIHKTIEKLKIDNYEIIYVDSKSTDDSIERALKFNKIKVLKLTGKCNPAIARNIGAENSSGDTLFFIDGDMEINSNFLTIIFEDNLLLSHNFISGQLKNINYNKSGKFIGYSWQYYGVLKGDKTYSTTGGVFIIKKFLWAKINGMDNRFKRGEDLDFGLRLTKLGFKLLRKKEIIANHHTIAYTHHSRIWETIFSGDISFSNSFLLRKHILNPEVYVKLVKQYYTLVSFLFLLLVSLIIQNFFVLYFYLIIVLIKTIRTKSKNFFRSIELYFFYIVRDASFIFYLFIPMKKIKESDIKYEIINDI